MRYRVAFAFAAAAYTFGSPLVSAAEPVYVNTDYVLREGPNDPALLTAAEAFCAEVFDPGPFPLERVTAYQLYTVKLDRDAGTVKDYLHKNVGFAFQCIGFFTPPFGPGPSVIRYHLENGDVFDFQGNCFINGRVGPPFPQGLPLPMFLCGYFATNAPVRFMDDVGFFNVTLGRNVSARGGGQPEPPPEIHGRGISVLRTFELVGTIE